MTHLPIPAARHLALLAGLLATLAACPGPASAPAPLGIVATVVSYAPGSGPEAGGAYVLVVNVDTGALVADATVTVNGTVLPWDPAAEDYEAPVEVALGEDVSLRVTAGGHTWSASGAQVAEPPHLDSPAAGSAWPGGCSGTASWTGGSSLPGDTSFLLAFDPGQPDAPPLLDVEELDPAGASVVVPGNLLPPGDVVFVVGLLRTVPVTGAVEGSGLVLVGGRGQTLHVADAGYRNVDIRPGNRGLTPGDIVTLAAFGPACEPGLPDEDLNGLVAWTSSASGVASVDVSSGLVTAQSPGIATITASVDGIGGSTLVGVREFTARAAASSLAGVAVGPAGIVAVGDSGAVLTSPDGDAWTVQSSGSGGELTAVAASPSRIVAVQYGDSTMITSTDGVVWLPGGLAGGSGLWSIVWTGTQFVAAGIDGEILTSPDGLAWTYRASGTPNPLTGVGATASLLLAVGFEQILTSPDGVTWNARTVPAGPTWLRSVVWTGSGFVAVGDQGSVTSPDGIGWTLASAPGGAAIASSGSELMVVGDFGAIATSADGSSWISWKVGDARLLDVVWTGSRWVIAGTGGILTTP